MRECARVHWGPHPSELCRYRLPGSAWETQTTGISSVRGEILFDGTVVPWCRFPDSTGSAGKAPYKPSLFTTAAVVGMVILTFTYSDPLLKRQP